MIVIVSRIPFFARYLFDSDSVRYALAYVKFSIADGQPQVPGYILFVGLGRVVNYLFNNPNTTMVFLSIIFSFLTVLIIYFMTKEIFSRKIAVSCSLLLIFNPIFWFYGEIASIYIFEAFFGVLITFNFYKVFKGDERFIYPSSLILGLAGGFRLDLLVFMLPLWLFSICYAKINYIKIFKAFFVLVVAVLLWFIPTLILTGGLKEFLHLAAVQSALSTNTSILLGSSVFQQAKNSGTAIIWTLWGLNIFGIGLILLYLTYHYSNLRTNFIFYLKNPLIIFFMLWIAPAFLFYIIIYIGKPGYTLIYLPALMIILGYILNRISHDLSITFPKISSRSILITLLFAGLIVNSIIYLYPYNLNQGETWETPPNEINVFNAVMYNNQIILAGDENSKLYIDAITNLSNSDPSSIIIVRVDAPNIGAGFDERKAQYYLSDYDVYRINSNNNSSYSFLTNYSLINVNTNEIDLNQSVTKIIWLTGNQTDFFQVLHSQIPINTLKLPNGLNIYYSELGNNSINLNVNGFIFKRLT